MTCSTRNSKKLCITWRGLRVHFCSAQWFQIKQLVFACGSGTCIFWIQVLRSWSLSWIQTLLYFFRSYSKTCFTFFFSTWRDQTPTHRMAEVSQSLGVCRASSCSFSSSCLPQYWTTWVGVTFHDTEILNTLILYGTTSPWVEGHCKLLEETHSLASHGSTVGFFIY